MTDLKARQLAQHGGNLPGLVGLWQKPPAFRQIFFPDIHKA